MTSTTARRMLYAAALGILLVGSPAIYAFAQIGGPSGDAAGPTTGGCGGMIGGGMMGGGMMGGGRSDGGMSGGGMMDGGMMGSGMMGSGDRPNQQWQR